MDIEIGGGANTYIFNAGYGQQAINDAGGSAAHGPLELVSDITEQNLWFQQAGNNLVTDRIGSADSVTVQGWCSGTGSKLSETVASDGMMINSGVAQLVATMASFASANTG